MISERLFAVKKLVEMFVLKLLVIYTNIILLLGQERFHNITTSYYRGAMGIMLVYDITNAKSFDNIAKWLRNIDDHANEVIKKDIYIKYKY